MRSFLVYRDCTVELSNFEAEFCIPMFHHVNLATKDLRASIRKGAISFGGNKKLKIYGLLTCSSGKRMLKANRLFFRNEEEAIKFGYRPCGVCMKEAYQRWKKVKNPTKGSL